MIKIIEGNILDYDKDIIVQQVNCKGGMGGGLASQIMDMYFEVPLEYKKYYEERMKTAQKTSELLGEVLFVEVFDGKVIANIFGQDNVRENEYDTTQYTDVPSLMKGIQLVKEYAEKYNKSIAIPTFIGCGLANGNWNEIKPLIENIFEGTSIDVTFYHFR